ncbi:uncharacterized protein E0L32_004177 [Thyridium curvatum]|uniref:CFEM domain-containing protein n=1 Tax=Thyridium curvatum TaxID=1093900 RepID=A0A507B1M5_9PEZI|nr:uncharacterized protein E0L32_004177 [Thyridium curvatum]TPX16182.1 hypothetical protein E0L32_004177 [Thyridium curvatum]
METTIVPFAALPSCGVKCGHLYDANGACVPPAKPRGDLGTYASCFCADPRVSPFAAGVSGVCDDACAGADLTSVRNWFTSFCAANAKGVQQQTTTSSSSTSTSGSNSGSNVGVKHPGPGGNWLTHHWQWVIFIVVMVVGIAGIWIGACIWRRRYLRKKDRQYALGKRGGLPSSQSQPSVHMPHAGMFSAASISGAGVYGESAEKKKDRKKWVVSERT